MGFWMLWGTYLWYAALIFGAIGSVLVAWGLLFKLFTFFSDDEDSAGLASLVIILTLLITGILAWATVDSQQFKPPAEAVEIKK